MAWCDGGYTTNLPLEDVTGGKAWVVYELRRRAAEPEHGGPARLLVPHLYFWKSAKWVRGLTLTTDDEPGFWEQLRLPQRRRPGRNSATGAIYRGVEKLAIYVVLEAVRGHCVVTRAVEWAHRHRPRRSTRPRWPRRRGWARSLERRRWESPLHAVGTDPRRAHGGHITDVPPPVERTYLRPGEGPLSTPEPTGGHVPLGGMLRRDVGDTVAEADLCRWPAACRDARRPTVRRPWFDACRVCRRRRARGFDGWQQALPNLVPVVERSSGGRVHARRARERMTAAGRLRRPADALRGRRARGGAHGVTHHRFAPGHRQGFGTGTSRQRRSTSCSAARAASGSTTRSSSCAGSTRSASPRRWCGASRPPGLEVLAVGAHVAGDGELVHGRRED